MQPCLDLDTVSTLDYYYSPYMENSSNVFNHDMFLNIPLIARIITLTCHCQALIDKGLLHVNVSCSEHEFKVNQYDVFIKEVPNKTNKLDVVIISLFWFTPTIWSLFKLETCNRKLNFVI